MLLNLRHQTFMEAKKIPEYFYRVFFQSSNINTFHPHDCSQKNDPLWCLPMRGWRSSSKRISRKWNRKIPKVPNSQNASSKRKQQWLGRGGCDTISSYMFEMLGNWSFGDISKRRPLLGLAAFDWVLMGFQRIRLKCFLFFREIKV